jgi:hypothetical protein
MGRRTKKREPVFFSKDGKTNFIVFLGRDKKGKDISIRCSFAWTAEKAISQVYHTDVEPSLKKSGRLAEAETVQAGMFAIPLKDRPDWKPSKKKPKIPWQPLLDGKPFRKKSTMAVSKKQAGCNRWFTVLKSHEDPTTDATKALYHERVSARPLFGQPVKPRQPRPRKYSHVDHGSLFDH